MKKLLYLSDLYNFYVTQNKNVKFSSKDDNTTIVVHIDEPFTYSKNEENDLLMYTPIRLCHTLTNKNKSHISEKAMKDAMSSAYNMPILGYIYKDENEEFQFAGHEFFVNEDNELEYEEQPCGTIPESAGLKLVKYDNDDRSYLEGTGIIWRTYSKASDIIEREKELSVSVELVVDELSFDSKTKELVIDKFRFSGVTILGKDRNSGEDIKPGMENSMISIGDFSEKNNSIFSQNEKVIEMLSALNEKIDNLNIDKNFKEGGISRNMFEELLKKYAKSIDDIDFEYEGLSDEELEAIFAEHFGTPSENFDGDDNDNADPDNVDYYGDDDGDPSGDDGDVDPSGNDGDDTPSGGDDPDPTPDPEPEPDPEPTAIIDDDVDGAEVSVKDNKKKVLNDQSYSVEYTIDIDGEKKTFSTIKSQLMALTTLVNETYGESDGCWYDCDADTDSKVVYLHDYWNDKHYRQAYSVKKDVYSLKGDRIEVFTSYLSADEIKQLESMKSNYSSIETKLSQYEAEPDKVEILESKDYDKIKNTEDYAKLAKRETYFEMSKEELVENLDKILLDYAKHGNLQFSEDNEPKKTVGMKLFGNPAKKASRHSERYGNFFNK